LPTTGAAFKRDKITLPIAIAKENNRASKASVQKAGRVSERGKKRGAVEEAREERAGDQASIITRGSKRARIIAPEAPRRSTRARK
jgi:hypothetical protein